MFLSHLYFPIFVERSGSAAARSASRCNPLFK
jgi:hypothetical protein